jgi:hypothetical protein
MNGVVLGWWPILKHKAHGGKASHHFQAFTRPLIGLFSECFQIKPLVNPRPAIAIPTNLRHNGSLS